MTGPVGLRQAAARLLGSCELIANLAEAVIRVETASGGHAESARWGLSGPVAPPCRRDSG
jgi:hypothetical protein